MMESRGSIYTLEDSSQLKTPDNDHKSHDSGDYAALEVDDFKITPGKISFQGAYNGKVFHETITIQNCGEHIGTILIGHPTSYAFKINSMSHGVNLAPGMKISRKITCVCSLDMSTTSQIPIRINEQTIFYVLEVQQSQAKIFLRPELLDFGYMNEGSKPLKQICEIHNVGTRTVPFSIEYGNQLMDLNFVPMKGEISAKSVLHMEVIVIGSLEGSHVVEFWVKPMSIPPIRGVVQVHTIKPRLQIFHDHTTGNLSLIDFLPTYYHSERHDTLIVNNRSAALCIYVVLIEHNGNLMTYEEAINQKVPYIQNFIFKPQTSALRPFMGRILQFTFSPKKKHEHHGWKHQKSIGYEETEDSLIFIRIVNVKDNVKGEMKLFQDLKSPSREVVKSASSASNLPLMESFLSKPQMQSQANNLFLGSGYASSSAMAVPTNSIVDIGLDTHVICPLIREQEKVRICLHGIAETAYISIVPDELNLGEIKMRESIYRVVSLKNESLRLPIIFKFVTKSCIKMKPKTGYLHPKQIVEVELCLTPINAGVFKYKIDIQALYPNSSYLCEDLQKVGSFHFGISYTVCTSSVGKTVRFNQGITPMVANEVGLNTEVTFNQRIKKPRAAILNVQKCPRHPKNEKDKCLIAFPNDRAQSLRNTNDADEVFRTIFTGQSRYKIPQAMIEAEMLKKLTNQSYYAKYLQSRALVRMANTKKGTSLTRMEYDIACKKVFNMMGFQMPKECILTQATLPIKFELTPRECLHIPLFPMQLYSIRVTPIILQFGVVTINTPSMQKIFVQNFNKFRIKISFQNINDQISFPEGGDRYVEAQSKVVISVSFTSSRYGRFSSLMNYVINDSHSFDVSLFADVVKKNLQIVNPFIDFSEYKADQLYAPTSLPIEIHNPVSADIQFNWSVSEDSAYVIIPNKGIVPNRRNVICHVYRSITYDKSLETEVFLIPESGVCKTANIKSVLAKPRVNFLVSSIEVKNIPLNVVQTSKLLILNHSLQEAVYQVDNPNPIPGVDIYPEFGVLKPRSYTEVYVNFQMKATIEFKFVVMIYVQRTFLLKCKVTGNVVFPKISIEPSRLKLRRISADGFDRMTFIITNESEGKVEIKFPLENYPEFHLSDSLEEIESPFPKGSDMLVLYPNKDKKLFIHFNPIDVASYEFYFPMIINDIIGPVDYEHPETEFTKHYLNSYEQIYRREYGFYITQDSLPKYVSTLRISVTVAGHALHISKNKICFNYSPNPYAVSDCEKTIRLTNVGRHDINFLIRIDNIERLPFDITIDTNSQIYFQKIDQSLVFTDVPVNFEILLTIKFVPTKPGIIKTQLPIYIKNYDFGGVFNYIFLKGSYPLPEISCDVIEIYFAPVPLNISNNRKIYIKAMNYHKQSVLRYESSSQYITVEFPDGDAIGSKKTISVDIPAIVCFQSQRPVSISEFVTFRDTNYNSCKIKIYATADNSVLTLHEFLVAYNECYTFETEDNVNSRELAEAPTLKMVNRAVFMNSSVTTKNDVSNLDPCIDYPNYPEENSATDIAYHLQGVVEACETMIYERVYTCFYNISIPEGFHSMVAGVDTKDVCAEVGETFESSIIQILIRLIGPAVNVFFNQRPIPTDSAEARSHYIFRLYTQFVHFLSAQGACLSHVDPLFLLSFNDYRKYVIHVMPIQEPTLVPKYTPLIPENIYNRRCKRLWLDVVLQLYKSTILCRVNLHSLVSHAKILNTKFFGLKPSEMTTPRTGWVLSGNDFDLFNHNQSNVYNLSERILLAWLNFHYEMQREIIWKNSEDIPPAKTITNFDHDLSDSIVFICVTASYCPYVIADYFSDLYGHVTILEMAYHNAACLISAWERLHIGLTITPEKIVHNNVVNMIMICIYLYSSFPHYIPSTTIRFETSLSTKTTQIIKVRTPTPGNLSIFFINNEKGYFSINDSLKMINVNSKGYELWVTFHAKKLRRIRVILLLAGNLTMNLRCESLVFTLEGTPTPLTPVQTIRLTGNLYEESNQVLHIAVPYHGPASYTIFRAEALSESLEGLRATPWSIMKDIKVPRSVYLHSTHFDYAPNSNGLHANISFLMAGLQTQYFIFVNPDVGDFIVRVDVIPAKSKPRELIIVPIPMPWCPSNCSCCGKVECTVNTAIPIPKKNKEMWECFTKAFRETLRDSDSDFWLARFETSIGLRMIQYLVNDESPTQEEVEHSIFKTNILYTISCDRPNLVTLPESIEIADTRGHGTIDLPVKLVKPCNMTLTLTSKDKSEIRIFSVNFVPCDSH